ncbi:MAG: hypothetical protein RXR18_05630 [Nitrososphaeria archaeon]
MTRRKKKGIISGAFYIMELPIRFVTEVTDDFISDTVSFIDPRRNRRRRGGVSTNY